VSHLVLDGLTKRYGDNAAVDDLSLAVEQGEFVSLLGPSGCGKTTTLQMIAGFVEPTSGSVRMAGRDLLAIPAAKRGLGIVFQNYALFPHMSVAGNVAFGLEMRQVAKDQREQRVAGTLKLVGLTGFADRFPAQLSGGQQQRVALARALAPQPKVLLLDEPLSALDYKLRKEMQIELKRLQGETGITFIFVTHDQEEVLTMSDRIAVMSSGKILQVGAPHDIYDRPAERFVADFIGETNFLEGEVVGEANGRATVKLSSGSEISASLPAGFSPTGKVTLVVRPEHAHLASTDDEVSLSGIIQNVVYLGTDTHFHVRLDDGDVFIVRQQNSRGASRGFEQDNRVGIVIGSDAAQLLKD
jgi:spermidine/putrescine transport system ATP-binding protein